MTERLVFDGERNEINALQSYYIAFALSLKKCWFVNFSCADKFVFVYINHRRKSHAMSILELCCFCRFQSSEQVPTLLPPAKKLLAVWTCKNMNNKVSHY